MKTKKANAIAADTLQDGMVGAMQGLVRKYGDLDCMSHAAACLISSDDPRLAAVVLRGHGSYDKCMQIMQAFGKLHPDTPLKWILARRQTTHGGTSRGVG